ncbi:HMA2 domain-containing protein [Desulforamulus ruminis]|uniref:HMA2 domain-containing protein n=1 Tax=Desulforamulus ruminis TaxID=1564 RepID=UPI002355D7E0|nr:hypothetical protein [Desulforamulus ruminis]
MSYMAGLAVGTLMAEQLRKAGGNGGIKLVHRTAGRRRYHDPRLKWDDQYAKKVEGYFKTVQGVNRFTINRITGSLVINYHCSEEFVNHLMKDKIFFPRAGKLRKRIQGMFGHMNAGVYKRTDGFLDFPTSLAGVFLILGLRKALRLKQWPSGPQMMWWSYNLMKKAH